MRTEYKEGDLLTKEDIGLVFKDREGYEVKITHYDERDEDYALTTMNKIGYKYYLTNTGSRLWEKSHQNDLVSFVGPDFTEDKKHIKIEFEATLRDCLNSKATSLLGDYLKNKNYVEHLFINAKFKFTMEELPND